MKQRTAEETTALRLALFSRRRFHEAGNRPGDTFERLRQRNRTFTIILASLAVVFTPILIGLFFYLDQNYGFYEPLPFWLVLLSCCVMMMSLIPCFLLCYSFFFPRESLGRWIIFGNGIFYRYGISPRRFVLFSTVRRVRVEMPNSGFACLVLETDSQSDSQPLRISVRAFFNEKYGSTEILPFLNLLLERLRKNGPKNIDLKELVNFQTLLRRQYISHGVRLMGLAYFLPIFLFFPFYFCFKREIFAHIANSAFPLVHLIEICVLFFACGWICNFFVQRWNNRYVDNEIENLK